jgi:hypothetical protein
MEADIHVDSVERSETRNGNVRWVVRDSDGGEYTTFREHIGEDAERYRGRRAHIEFHEEKRGNFRNVYLDGIRAAAGGDDADGGGGDSDPDEVAWSTAVDAAPWLLGTSEPKKALDPDDLYDKLEPFKQRVSEDIRRHGDDEDE